MKVRFTAVSVMLLCGVVSLTACGSSKAQSAKAQGTTSPSATAATSGTPIVLGMDVSVHSTSGISYPDIEPAAEAAISDVNAAGGIHGRDLKLDFCDDQDNPQVAAQCGNQLVNTDHVVAVIGGASRQDDALYPYLAAKKIPWICNGATVNDDFTSPESYPCTAGNDIFGDMVSLMNPSWKALTVLHSSDPVGLSVWTLAKSAAKAKTVSTSQVIINFTTTNMQPYVQGIASAKSQAWTIAGTQTQMPALLSTESSLGIKAAMLISSSALSPSLITEQRSSGLTVRSPLQFDIVTPSTALKQVQADFAKYDSKIVGDTSDSTLAAWLGVKIFADYANQASSISSSGFQAWLNTQSALQTGLTAPLNFTKAGPIPGAPRVVNVYAKPAALQDGTFHLLNQQWTTSVPGAAPLS